MGAILNPYGEPVTDLWVFGISVPGAAWTVIGPIVMADFRIRVSGVRLTERGLRKAKPDYEVYLARTQVLVPPVPEICELSAVL
jgi:steroid 5-alpha reductase family enzyme